MRQMKLADDDFDINTEVVLVTQNLNHSASRILRCRGPVSDCDIHNNALEIVPFGAAGRFIAENAIHRLVFLLRRTGCPRDNQRAAGATKVGAIFLFRILHPWRDYDLLRNLLIKWRDVVAATAVMKNSHDCTVGTRYRPHNAAFGSAIGTDCDNLHQHMVAMHCGSYGGRRNENVSGKLCLEFFVNRGRVGGDESEAVAMHA